MKEDIEELINEFSRIKRMGLIKSLRDGPTGVGYTFETLLNKKEDQLCLPDFKSIELKCRLGYSKSSITLFNCVPKRNGSSAVKYIFEIYGHYRYGNKNDCKIFTRKVFSKYAVERYKVEFKLSVNYYEQKIVLKAYENGNYKEEVCYWEFKDLERKLKMKLKTLAVIDAYPYRKECLHYKYVKIKIYKLKGFFEFLKLITEDKIYVNFYIKNKIGENCLDNIEDHGVGFRIKYNSIEELFYKIKT